ATALLLMLQPAIQLRKVTRIRNRVPVLVDRSQSMTLQAAGDDETRLQVVQRFLGESAGRLRELSRDYAFDFFTFDTQTRPASQDELQERLVADGEGTDLLAALKEATASVPKERLGGVIVLSDGADNGRLGRDPELMPEAARDFVKQLGAPI